MYVVIGTWPIDPSTSDDGGIDAEVGAVAAAVRRYPGFVQGYWGVDVSDPGAAHAVVVLDTRARATAFAAGVAASIGGAQVRVIRVV